MEWNVVILESNSIKCETILETHTKKKKKTILESSCINSEYCWKIFQV